MIFDFYAFNVFKRKLFQHFHVYATGADEAEDGASSATGASEILPAITATVAVSGSETERKRGVSSLKRNHTDDSEVSTRRIVSALKNNRFVAVGSKYDISSYNVTVNKPAVWNLFAMSMESVLP